MELQWKHLFTFWKIFLGHILDLYEEELDFKDVMWQVPQEVLVYEPLDLLSPFNISTLMYQLFQHRTSASIVLTVF